VNWGESSLGADSAIGTNEHSPSDNTLYPVGNQSISFKASMKNWVCRFGTLKWRMSLNGSNGGPRLTLVDDTEPGVGLHLIGTGVGSPLNMSVGGQRVASACEYRFLEGYTSLLQNGGEDILEELVGTYEIIRRPQIEEPGSLLEMAKKTSVALLVVGDPMQATTHVDLLLRCKERGILTTIHHAVSVVDVICAGIGLQSYRFGRQVTLTFPHGGHLPTSPLEMIADNLLLGLHTLVLLDLDPTGSGSTTPSPMSPNGAIEVMEEMAKRLKDDPPPHLQGDSKESVRQHFRKKAVSRILEIGVRNLHGVICSNMGGDYSKVALGTLSELAGGEYDGIHSLVVTGDLLGMEEEALVRLN